MKFIIYIKINKRWLLCKKMSYSTKITNINSSKIQTIDLLENIDFEYLECIASERLSPSTGTAE